VGVPAPEELPALVSPEPFKVEHFESAEPTGDPVLVEESLTSRLLWMGPPAPGLAEQGTSVRISGDMVAKASGDHAFGLVTGTTGWLSLDGTVVLDNREDRLPGPAFFGAGSAEIRTQVHLESGQRVHVEAATASMDGIAFGGLELGHAEPRESDPLGAAVDAATDAEAAVVVVGGNAQWETEGSDRGSFELPGGQPELVRAVCEANPRTVVVVNCGAPVDLSCADAAAAIVLCWYPGQEAGAAVADVLLGDADPGGRLPTTWGRDQSDWQSDQNFPGDEKVVRYEEGFAVGYRGFDRHGIDPAYCFGHGLSYAAFEWSEPTLSVSEMTTSGLLDGDVIDVGATLTNVSDRPGVEVVQVYVAPVGGEAAGEDRPPQWLAGFDSVELAAGESRTVSIPLGGVAFRRWESGWVVPSGDWEIRVSASSRDHRFGLPVQTTA
ncbi:MAG: glycoside hydrolase family 3 C-terminal domain-containing protein, partial [Microthrixaceae bacterium]